MGDFSLGIDKLSESLRSVASGSGDASALSSGIYSVLLGWFQTSVFSVILTILIFVVVLFVFYGAFLYVTAYGDENRATRAKKTLLYAFIGLAIALISFSAMSYVQRILITKSAEKELEENMRIKVKNPGP